MPADSFAAIDLGSNSFHMIVVRAHEAQVQVLDRLREMVQLAAGLDEQQRLSATAQQRALDCLARFAQRIAHLPPSRVRIVGTNTLRQARNGAAFLARAEAILGHRIEVISGMEEARLIYLGVAHTTAGQGRRLVVDIGGGSTELIVGEQFEPHQLESLYMGCVSMTRRCFSAGRIREADLIAAELAVRQELEPVEAAFRAQRWDEAIGASGSIKAIRDVLVWLGWCSDDITAEGMQRLRSELLAADAAALASRFDLSAERASVFVGGFAVLHGIFESLGLERMRVSDGALREGLIYDLLGRVRHEDVRARSVRVLGSRFASDEAHGQRVAQTAMALRAQVADGWELDDEDDVSFLAWAAQLHEIGLTIAHSQYHKHGGYILANADLPGFSRTEQSALAALVRGHRRKFPLDVFNQLPAVQNERMQRLCVLLRLACVLHRSRSRDPLPALTLAADGHALRLLLPPGWLESHPLSCADLEAEAGWLAAAGWTLNFAG